MIRSNMCLSVVSGLIPTELLRGYQSSLYGSCDGHSEHVGFSANSNFTVTTGRKKFCPVVTVWGVGYWKVDVSWSRLPELPFANIANNIMPTQLQTSNKSLKYRRYKSSHAFALSSILETQLKWCGHWTPNRWMQLKLVIPIHFSWN